MNYRLKTTNQLEEKIIYVQQFLNLQTKASAIRLAISYSLKLNKNIDDLDSIINFYKSQNFDGGEYNRATLFGSYEKIYKVIIEEIHNSKIDDDSFFPIIVYYHINRGISELVSDLRLAKTKEKFLSSIME